MQNKKALKTGTIRQTVFIDAPPEKVYEAFVNAKIHAAFTGSKATGAAKVGSKITAWNGYITGKNIKLQKGKMIIQEWRTSEWPEGYGYSILKLTFKKKGKGTALSMIHSKVPGSQVKEYTSGWPESYWEPLKMYFSQK